MKLLLTAFCTFFSFATAMPQYFNIQDYGATGEDESNDTKAIQQAINSCAHTGGVVLFPPGTYFSSTVFLESNIHVLLQAGAVWKGLKDSSLYPFIPPHPPSRMDMVPRKAFIYAANKENITISGQGKIYASGGAPDFQNLPGDNPNRPFGLHFVKCKNLHVEGIRFENSAFWGQRYYMCDQVRLNNLVIYNHVNLNNDGIDLDGCHDVVVTDCIIDASDDALVLKSEGPRDTRDVTVSNCILSSHASAFKCGTASIGGFRRITVSNLVIRPSKSKTMHHVLKAWGGLAGIDLGCVDGGTMQDISISNVVMDSVETPVFIRLGKRHDRPWDSSGDVAPGIIRDIQIQNITARNTGKYPCSVTGYEGNKVRNVTFSNLHFNLVGGGSTEDTSLAVPDNATAYPMNRMYGKSIPAYGFYVRHAENIRFNGVSLHLQEKDQRPAFVFDDVKTVALTDFSAAHTSDYLPLLRFVNTQEVLIKGDNNLRDLEKFIEVKGQGSKNFVLHENLMVQPNETFTPLELEATAENPGISLINLRWKSSSPHQTGLNHYVVYRDGQEIASTREVHFVDKNVRGGKKYQYTVTCVNAAGFESRGVSARVKAKNDNVPPGLASHEIITNEEIELVFSEPLDTGSALEPSHYYIENIEIRDIQVIGKRKVLLQVAPVPAEKTFTLTIQGIRDASDNHNEIARQNLQLNHDPLVAYWDFDRFSEGVFPAVKGEVGLEAHQVKQVEDEHGKAIYLDGKGAYLRAKDHPGLDMAGNMAVSLRFKLANPELDRYCRILSKREAWDQPSGYELECNPARDRLNFSGGNTGPGGQGVIHYSFDDKWHHLIVVARSGEARFYMDGKKAGTDTETARPKPNGVDLYLGSTPGLSDFFHGALDEVKIFSRALSPSEIEALFQEK